MKSKATKFVVEASLNIHEKKNLYSLKKVWKFKSFLFQALTMVINQPYSLTRSVCFESYSGATCFNLVFSFSKVTHSVLGYDLASIIHRWGECFAGYRKCSCVTFVLKYQARMPITTTDFFSTVFAFTFASASTSDFVQYLVTSYSGRQPGYRSWTLVNKTCNNISRVWWDD